MRISQFLVALLFLLSGKLAIACDTCTIYFGRLSSEVTPGFSFGISEQLYTSNSLRLDGVSTPNPLNQSLETYVTRLNAQYTLNKLFAFQLNVPYA